MAHDEIQQTGWVDSDHRVILNLPHLPAGTEVHVKIEPICRERTKNKRRPGSAEGLITIQPGFDDALDEFVDYN